MIVKQLLKISVFCCFASFPGGRIDHEDTSVVETALRETEEELGYPRNKIDIWTTMPAMIDAVSDILYF